MSSFILTIGDTLHYIGHVRTGIHIEFLGTEYELVLSDHAVLDCMPERSVTFDVIKEVVDSGKWKPSSGRETKGWIFKAIEGRDDNLICLTVSLEAPYLIVINVMHRWEDKR